MRSVERIHDCSVWPTAAAAYSAARDFIESEAAAPLGDFVVRPVPVAGRFALQLETPRLVTPHRVLGYLREDPNDLETETEK